MNSVRYAIGFVAVVVFASLAAASPVPIVRWYDDYHRDPNPGKSYRAPLRDTLGQNVTYGLDVDSNAATTDSVVWWNFSMSTPLTPVLPSVTANATYRADRPSAMFYGGLVGYYPNYSTSQFAQSYVMYAMGAVPDPAQPNDTLWKRSQWVEPSGNSAAYSDMAIFLTWGSSQLTVASAFQGLFMWKKQDFLSGGSSSTVALDGGTQIAVAQTRLWNGVEEARFVVQNGSNFYISEYAFGGAASWRLDSRANADYYAVDPSAVRWSTYVPHDGFDGTVYGINFDEDAAMYDYRSFSDVQAVGIYVEKDTPTIDPTVFVFDDFRVMATVPEPRVGLLMVFGILAAGWRPRRCACRR